MILCPSIECMPASSSIVLIGVVLITLSICLSALFYCGPQMLGRFYVVTLVLKILPMRHNIKFILPPYLISKYLCAYWSKQRYILVEMVKIVGNPGL